jgi:respiratory nitrate reductase, gamma subunit
MSSYIHHFFFGIYPYLVLVIFAVGCLIRFEREQYSWKSESSQLLHTGSLRLGNILFHLGIIGIVGGHVVGLLTPLAVWEFLGISHSLKQLAAMIAGGIMGTTCLIGLLMLIYRRVTSERLWALTTWRDLLVLGWLLATLILGLSTIAVSAGHMDGEEMVLLINWVQHIVTFRGDAANYIEHVSILFKLHIFMGLSLFAIFPFTRLVHIFSGIATLAYLQRAWQLVRPRGVRSKS